MDIGSILLILALAVLAGVFVSQPFNRPASAGSHPITRSGENLLPPDELESRRSALQAERLRLLNVLSELDSDYSLGKVPQEDYPIQRSALLQSGASVLRQLDELKPPVEPPQAPEPAGVEKGNAPIGQRFCSHCGSLLQPEDRFCSRCGQKVI